MRTLKIAIVSLLLMPAAAAAAGVGGLSATFSGKTSQSRLVVIRVAQGSVTAPSRLSWSARCGTLALGGTARFAGGLGGNGSFSPPPVHSVTRRGGLRLKLTTTVRFKISGRLARGAFTTAWSAYSPSGAQVQRCGPRTVTFTAHR